MATLRLTMPDATVGRIEAAMKGVYPIPQIEDPREPPGDGIDPAMVNEFTDREWVSEMTRRWIRDMVAEWEREQATPDAVPDDTIITR